jgi:TPR repeat protein
MKNSVCSVYICLLAFLLCFCGKAESQNYLKKAKSGNVQAQVKLAEQYYSGIGQLQSYKQALVWYEKAAKNGNVDAIYKVAVMHEQGKGCQSNVRDAFNYYLKAAERGHCVAQSKVAAMFEKGEGTTQSDARAYLWYRVCAERDDVFACRKMGDYYSEGKVVGKDHAEAKYWYEKALNTVDNPANNKTIIRDNELVTNNDLNEEVATILTNLAKLYTADEGLAPNPEKAKQLLKQAEEIKR